MGKKSHGKTHERVKLPVQETNVGGLPKTLSPQKRDEVNHLVGKLLKGEKSISDIRRAKLCRKREHIVGTFERVGV
jgi:hypothetical protein